MNRYSILLMFFFSIVVASPAKSADYIPYATIQAGGVFLDEIKNKDSHGTYNMDLKTGFSGALILGADLGDNFPKIGKGRLELEIGYRKNALDEVEFVEGSVNASGDITLITMMLNSCGGVPVNDRLDAYICGGVGAGQVSLNDVRVESQDLVDDEDVVFAWQVGTGIGYTLSKRLTLDIGYRYLGTSHPKFTDSQGNSFNSQYSSHNIIVGLRTSF